MEDKTPCMVIGKCVGSAYRKIAEETQKAGVLLEKVFHTVKEDSKEIFARLGNLFKRVKTDSQLAHWEMKQKDNFARLGEEILRLKEAELDKLFKEEDVKKILAQIKNDDGKIHDIKDATARQRRKMEEMILFKHAVKELRNPGSRMRRVALRVLERLGKREAIPHLVGLLNDPEPEIRTRASEVIQKLSEIEGQPAMAGQ